MSYLEIDSQIAQFSLQPICLFNLESTRPIRPQKTMKIQIKKKVDKVAKWSTITQNRQIIDTFYQN